MTNFKLSAYAASCGVADPLGFAAKCDILRDIILEANQTMNLTRITEPEEFAIKHVADSLSIAREFPELTTEYLKIADIGCGAGFPTLVLAMAFPNLRFTAIDSTGKKIAFVERAAIELGLRNVKTRNGRSVELNRLPEIKHQFDIVTARAVGTAPIIYLDACDFVKRKTGKFILYKTPQQLESELPALELACKKLPISWHTTKSFELPNGAGTRLFLYSTVESASRAISSQGYL
ncbi:MAG: 16S rRNA (guanine(527)-N(7))-methyltransferase RsmG [Victivallales bacterium]|jgi:16S rRNA (guanine527-N7)-methyltransferase|nr:16S rRNA (guanine(527)-N(7))-methyltransferase RsmG [Victivallales bacterium]